ncbi:unnamed protein product [Ambrosiozyma monospora]|uniref:alpha,alpha-trehalase n=1 Tax=Ambrosiozyma monospora TaxID=43982 RepID=A0A9W6Z0W9_AMBMO|nr:unnamed protein product [Ambrosiozyma monospora]
MLHDQRWTMTVFSLHIPVSPHSTVKSSSSSPHIPYFKLHRKGSASSNYDYFDNDTETYYFQNERRLVTTKFNPYNHYTNQPYVANGYIGSRIPNLGFGFTYDQNENNTSSMLDNGWPLFNRRFSGAFIAGFYDAQKNTTGTNFPELLDNGGYESVVSAIPQWTNLIFEFESNDLAYTLDPSLTNTTDVGEISNYKQELNMWTGVVTTSYTWLDLLDLKISVVAHREIETLGLVNVEISTNSSDSINLKVKDLLDFETSQRCSLINASYDDDGIFMQVNPNGISYKSASIYSVFEVNGNSNTSSFGKSDSDDSAWVSSNISICQTSSVKITKYVGIVSDDLSSSNYSDKSLDLAKKTAIDASQLAFNELLQEHEESWKSTWSNSKVEITSDPYLTLAAESSIYHLLANTRPDNEGVLSALAVGGLSSDSYAGMVFWDSDLWMLPSLIPISPDTSKSISNFRYFIHNQSRINAQEGGYNGSVYSWTSGRFGNCTGTGPCLNYEYHLNVAICYSYWKMYLAGAIDDDYLLQYGWPIIEDSATFFEEYVKWNGTLGKYTTHNLTDPDEYANFKDNAAYTAVGISQLMKWATVLGNHLGVPIHEKWTDVMKNMYLPVSNDNVTLEFDTMNSTVAIKQADVVLISYIDDWDDALDSNFDYTRQRAYRDLLYYSEHQSSQGPAMTFPVFNAVTQKLNNIGCGSQTYLAKSVEPFLRFPFAQMSEQNNDDYDTNGGTHPAFPFLTGHGGVLQSYLYGLTGLRFSYNVSDDGSINKLLAFDPTDLPLLEGDLHIYDFKYLNQSLDISIGSVNASIYHRGDSPVTIFVPDRNPESGYYVLQPGSSLNIPVFITEDNFEESITECAASPYEISKGMHGDVIESIIDGDNSTKWQAENKDVWARVVVDLNSIESISKGHIVWEFSTV